MTSTTERKRDPKSLIFGILLLAFGAFVIINGIRSATDSQQRLLTPSGFIQVEVVDTPELRTKGLSGRDTLDDRQGMLFVFDEASQEHCFWMKDMRFAIDMIWMDEEKKVVTVHEHVSPDTYPASFCPAENAKYGLELSAGQAKELEIVVDEQLRF